MILTSKLAQFRLVTGLFVAVMLAACGGGSGPDQILATPSVGVLINSPIEGVNYVTATQSGVTNVDGEFRYYPGEMVTFSIGAVLSTVPAAPVITPVELTGSVDPGTDTMPNAATNLMILLQSIDADQSDASRITISAATRAAIQALNPNQIPDFNDPNFANALPLMVATVAPGNAVVTYTDALNNFCQSYLSLITTVNFSWSFMSCAPPVGGTADLLTNGSFESPDASAGDVLCATSWSCVNDSYTNSNLYQPGGSFTGPDARTGTQKQKQYGDDGIAFQDVPATPGATYTASAWAQNWTGDALNRVVLLQLFFLDSGGNNISGGFVAFDQEGGSPVSGGPETYLPPDTWVQLTASGVAPANAATARIQLIHLNNNANVTGNTGGAVFWDDATLVGPSSAPATVELLTTRSFESPDASAGDVLCATSWSCVNDSYTNSNLYQPGGSFTGPDARTGTQKQKQYGDDGIAFQDVPATPGATYTASAWAQNWTGDALNRVVLLQLFFLDSGGNNISGGFVAFDQEGGSPVSGGPETYLPPDTWVQLTASGVAPANAATARIQLIHLNNNANVTGNTGGAVFWDDASLTGPGPGSSSSFNTLKFSDEFDPGTSLDTNIWTLETGTGPNFDGWGNNEWQVYTTSTNNIDIEIDPNNATNGHLRISALLDPACPSPAVGVCGFQDGNITSARIKTLPNISPPNQGYTFKYGRIEASIKLPVVGYGAWPAFWMLGENYPIVGWPKTGEIDVVEMFGKLGVTNQEALFTLHWCDESLGVGCAFPNGYATNSGKANLGQPLGNAFRVYAAEWDPSGVTWSVDGVTSRFTAIQPATMEEFLENFFIILNVAIGGNPFGPIGTPASAPDATGWPRTMLVDYVKVYQ